MADLVHISPGITPTLARRFDDGASQYLSGTAGVTSMPLVLGCRFRADDASLVGTLVSLDSDGADNNWFRLAIHGLVSPKELRANLGWDNGITFSQKDAKVTVWQANRWYWGVAEFASTSSQTVWLDGASGTDATGTTAPANIAASRIGVYRTALAGFSQFMSGDISHAFAVSGAWSNALQARLMAGEPLDSLLAGRAGSIWQLNGSNLDLIGGYHLTAVNSPRWRPGPYVRSTRSIFLLESTVGDDVLAVPATVTRPRVAAKTRSGNAFTLASPDLAADTAGTFVCRFKSLSSGNDHYPFSADDGSTFWGFGVREDDSNKLQVYTFSGGFTFNAVTAANAVKPGREQMLAVSSNGSTTRVYVDGVEKTLTPTTGSNNGQFANYYSDPWFIGLSNGNSAIWDCRYYSGTALSAQDLRKLAAGIEIDTKPTRHWHLKGNARESVAGEHLAKVGTPRWANVIERGSGTLMAFSAPSVDAPPENLVGGASSIWFKQSALALGLGLD